MLVTTHSSPDKEQREARLPLDRPLQSLAPLTKLVSVVKNHAVYVQLTNFTLNKSLKQHELKNKLKNFTTGESKKKRSSRQTLSCTQYRQTSMGRLSNRVPFLPSPVQWLTRPLLQEHRWGQNDYVCMLSTHIAGTRPVHLQGRVSPRYNKIGVFEISPYSKRFMVPTACALLKKYRL